MTTYRYLTVDEWGGTWTRPPVAEKLLDGECYVHHSAGNDWDDLDAIKAFQTLNQYAQQQKGYSFLDYDVLVHYHSARDIVTIGEGRGKWLSAATRDRNEQGEAVCVLGYFHPGHALTQRPLAVHLEGTARAIVWGIEQGWLSRDLTILGHRDNPAHPGATGCPGDYLYAELPKIRTRVAELLRPTPPDHTEDPDMAKMNVINVRWNGYADVVTGFHTSAETLALTGAGAGEVVVLPKPDAATLAKIERELGHPLTPL
jgi:hypothetical protein